MKKYAQINKNDFCNGVGVSVSFWVQGCPHRCEGCHNPETWDFNGGQDLPTDYIGQIIQAISANDIKRNLSILGGEPLAEQNLDIVLDLLCKVVIAYPKIDIYLWTGYTYKELMKMKDDRVDEILSYVDYLIVGKYEQDKRDVSLWLRGSSNQKVLDLKTMNEKNKNKPLEIDRK